MEGVGYSVSRKQVEEDGQKLLDALDAVVQENQVGDKFVHSVVLTWDEAFLVESKLLELSHGKNARYSTYHDTNLPAPRIGLDAFGVYRGLNLWVGRPVSHVQPSHKVIEAE